MIVFLIKKNFKKKKLEEMTWVRIMHKLLTQKTQGEVKVLRGALNPKVD